jgi:chromosomal replication initiator protein
MPSVKICNMEKSQDYYSKLWDKAKASLKGTVPQSIFDSWYNRLSFDSQAETELTLKAPSKFIADNISKRFMEDLQVAVNTVSQANMKIRIIVSSAKQTKSQAPTKAADSTAVQGDTPSKKEETKGSYRFNPNYTFDSFVPGEDNQFAFNTCKVISLNPGTNYNPCLIYGSVGLGKTHLLQAIGNSITKSSKLKVVYVTTENFTSEFIEALKSQSTQAFKNKYRKVNVLLMDDIQTISGKEATQTELFNTFNDLYDSGGQMVFTCDRPIAEVSDIADRLKNRFTRGIIIDIQQPKYETRVAILRKKSQTMGFQLTSDVIDYIAKNVNGSVRDLESCLTTLHGYANLLGGKGITIENARDVLKNTIRANIDKSSYTIDKIIKAVAEYYNLSTFDIKGNSKKKTIAIARMVAMYICRDNTEFSTTEIGVEFSGRDHTTVLYACNKVKSMYSMKDPEVFQAINSICEMLSEKPL